MEEILERQLLIRDRAFATFSTFEKAVAGRKKSFRSRMLCRPGIRSYRIIDTKQLCCQFGFFEARCWNSCFLWKSNKARQNL